VASTSEFGDFVAARSSRLLRVAYLLTRDWALAEDLLQTALAKAWSSWRRIDTDPEAYVRRILVNTYSSWWRRPWLHERPTGQLPDGAGHDEHRRVDEREEMFQALARLPKRQRAVLVLRYYEDLSEAEIAETLGIAAGTVKSLAAAGLANLRTDTLFQGEPSAHHVRLAAVADRVKRDRRRTAAVVGAACLVVVAILLGYAISAKHRSGPHPQPLTTVSPVQVGALPEYYLGTHVAQAVTVSAANPRAQILWYPTKAGGQRLLRCQITTPEVWVTYSVSDGDSTGTSECRADYAGHLLQGYQRSGASPITLTIQVEYAEKDGVRVPVPPDFALSFAITDNVDWADYVFPPTPSAIPMLGRMLEVNTTYITSDEQDPMKPRTVRIRLPRQLGVLADGTGPTRLHIMVDGVELLDFRKWSYDPPRYPLYFQPDHAGRIVTVTISPEHATGPWSVELVDKCGADRCPVLDP
jgi:RNA polymerase sigma-70 factor (sigma-E family)